MNIVQTVIAIIIWLVTIGGYPLIFLLMTGEAACLLIPSEVVMPFAGYLAYKGNLDFTLVVFTGTFANLFGSLIAYYVGLKLGRRWILKYGKYFLLSKDNLKTSERLFKRYGDSIIFASRMLPVIRTFISLPAGIGKMNLKKFTIYTFVGSLPWNFAFTYFGFILGEHWTLIEDYIRQFDIVLITVAVAIVLFFIYRRLKKQIFPKI